MFFVLAATILVHTVNCLLPWYHRNFLGGCSDSVHHWAPLTLQWDYVYGTEVRSRFWLPPFLTPSLPTLQSPNHLQIIVSIHLFFLLKCWIHSCLFHNLNYFLSPRIYQSLDYIEDNATVFHAYYLSSVANAEIKNSVALGHFILPPASLQKG